MRLVELASAKFVAVVLFHGLPDKIDIDENRQRQDGNRSKHDQDGTDPEASLRSFHHRILETLTQTPEEVRFWILQKSLAQQAAHLCFGNMPGLGLGFRLRPISGRRRLGHDFLLGCQSPFQTRSGWQTVAEWLR